MINIKGLDLNINKDTIVTVVGIEDGAFRICDGASVVTIETDMKLKIGDLLKLDTDGQHLVLSVKKAAKTAPSKHNPPKDMFGDYKAF